MSKYKSQAGVGTIIMFIAMIFVATIAAGVLLQTSMNLQSKALSTGAKAENSVSNAIILRNMYGTDGTTSSLTSLYATIQVTGGSTGIKFDDLLLQIETFNDSRSYAYNQTVSDCENVTFQTGEFAVEYVLSSVNQQNDYLLPGDIAKLCFDTMSLSEGRNLLFKIIPQETQSLVVEITAPETYDWQSVDLYP